MNRAVQGAFPPIITNRYRKALLGMVILNVGFLTGLGFCAAVTVLVTLLPTRQRSPRPAAMPRRGECRGKTAVLPEAPGGFLGIRGDH